MVHVGNDGNLEWGGHSGDKSESYVQGKTDRTFR